MNKILEKIDIPKGLIKLLNENPIPKLEEEITDFYFIKSENLLYSNKGENEAPLYRTSQNPPAQ